MIADYVESKKKDDDLRLLKETVERAPTEHQRDLMGAVWEASTEQARDEISEGLLQIATADDRARIRVHTQERLQATDEYRVRTAADRMREKNSAYDEPVDLGALWDSDPVKPTVCAMTSGVCVLYEGYRNGLFGPTESGKTMLALMTVIQEIQAGRPIVYLDFENTPHAFVDRLRTFGATKDQVTDHVRYFFVTGALPSPDRASVMAADLVKCGGRFVAIDTVHAAMTELGLDPFLSNQVEHFYKVAVDPWAQAGCAPVVLDHTTKKDPFEPYGSERKKSGISGMNLNVVPAVRFDQRTAGYSKVYVNKDRHGGGPEYADETRLFAELHVIPPSAGPGATTHGVLELRPLSRGAVAARAAEDEQAKAGVKAMAEEALRGSIRDWVQRYDDGGGVFESWAVNGGRKGEVRIPGVGGNTGDIRAAIKKMLDDPSDPLTRTDDDKRIHVGSPVIPGAR